MRILQFPKKIELEKSKKITELTSNIAALATALQHIPITATQKETIFHQELLKSSLFSAKIEGNQLTLIQAKQIDISNPKIKSQIEISNVIKARKKIESFPPEFTTAHLQKIHEIIMKNLHANAGIFRVESSAIFDQYGNVVYITPNPDEVTQMLKLFFEEINTTYKNPEEELIKIAQSHYYFEKIHPFLDGNGRTGRILVHYQLNKIQLFNNLVLPIEEYLNSNRSNYYELLDQNTREIEPFVLFFLDAIIWSLHKLLEDIRNLSLPNIESIEENKVHSLLPRRQEILQIITDHPYCSFDFISRRFATIPKRTLAYDINQLVKQKLLTKHGETRGVVYSRLFAT